MFCEHRLVSVLSKMKNPEPPQMFSGLLFCPRGEGNKTKIFVHNPQKQAFQQTSH